MERFTLNGLITTTVNDIVGLSRQLDALIELGNFLNDGLRMTTLENREAIKGIREHAWTLDRLVRGCDTEQGTEQMHTTLSMLVADIVDGKLNEAFDDMDWAKYNVVTHDELSDYATECYVDDKTHDLPSEDNVRDIVDDMIGSLKVTIKRDW